MDVSHTVQQTFGLSGDGAGDLWMRVADIAHAEGRSQVDESISIRIPEVRKGSALPEDWRWIEGGHVLTFDSLEDSPSMRTRGSHGSEAMTWGAV